MLMEHTLQMLKALRLLGMAAAFEEQQLIAASADLSFDERFSMLVDREQSWRDNRRVFRCQRLRVAHHRIERPLVLRIRFVDGELKHCLVGRNHGEPIDVRLLPVFLV